MISIWIGAAHIYVPILDVLAGAVLAVFGLRWAWRAGGAP